MTNGKLNDGLGLIGNIQKYSLHDGPGIRTTVFLKGCPLSCAWCHNPENLLHKPELLVHEERCVRCGECGGVCPRSNTDAASVQPADDARLAADTGQEPAECQACGACANICPAGAKTIVGRWMPPSELMREILADRIFYDESKGGVTFSGGEPLLQHAFLASVLKACRAQEIHTAVDTCGYAPEACLRNIVPFIDLFLFDLKFIDEAKHREYTGVSNVSILQNLSMLSQIHRQLWIRIPVIPGVNDSPDELRQMANRISALKTVRQVNLLPYHRTGVHKFTRMGQEYGLHRIAPPTPEYMEAVAEKFASLKVPVIVGG